MGQYFELKSVLNLEKNDNIEQIVRSMFVEWQLYEI